MAALAIGLAFVWRLSPIDDDEYERRLLAVTTEQAGLRLGDYLELKVSLLRGLAREWSSGAISSSDQLYTRALTVQAESQGFQAIGWVDATGVITMLVPLTPNRAALGRNVHDTPADGAAFDVALKTKRVTASAPMDLVRVVGAWSCSRRRRKGTRSTA